MNRFALKLIGVVSIGLSSATAFAASSDSFPWSTAATSIDGPVAHRDINGALTDVISSPASVSGSSTESAAPGGATATNPIGAFSNNPTSTNGYAFATSSGLQNGSTPGGSSYNGGDVAEGNIGPAQSGPGAAGLFTPNSPGNAAALSAQMHSGLEGSPIVDGSGSNLRVLVPVATPSQSPSYEQISRGGITGQTANTGSYSLPARPSTLEARGQRQLPPNLQPLGTANRATLSATPRATTLGAVTGSIQYGDGKVVLFGTDGIMRINREKKAVLKLNDGRVRTVPVEKALGYLKNSRDLEL